MTNHIAMSLLSQGHIKMANVTADDKKQAALALAEFLLNENAVEQVQGSPGLYRLYVVTPETMR